ncbi:hypothetical protein M405DRAFT_714028, partial [Rhizopogon salebrosus TDB-379]
SSATLPPLVLAQVRTVMHIQSFESYHINRGMDCPNTCEVRHLNGARSDLESLKFILPHKYGGQADADIFKRTMIFRDDIGVLMAANRRMKAELPAEQQKQVGIYHSKRITVLHSFREGKIDVPLMTEAAGMVSSLHHSQYTRVVTILDIEWVVQFLVPQILSIWMQR